MAFVFEENRGKYGAACDRDRDVMITVSSMFYDTGPEDGLAYTYISKGLTFDFFAGPAYAKRPIKTLESDSGGVNRKGIPK